MCACSKSKRQLFRSQFSPFTGSWGWLPRIELWWAGWAASAFTHLSHLPAQPMRIFNRLKFKDQNHYRITTVGGWWLLTSLGRGPGLGFQNEPMCSSQPPVTLVSADPVPFSGLSGLLYAPEAHGFIQAHTYTFKKKKKQVLRDT